jgi:hypothetical protein
MLGHFKLVKNGYKVLDNSVKRFARNGAALMRGNHVTTGILARTPGTLADEFGKLSLVSIRISRTGSGVGKPFIHSIVDQDAVDKSAGDRLNGGLSPQAVVKRSFGIRRL